MPAQVRQVIMVARASREPEHQAVLAVLAEAMAGVMAQLVQLELL